MAVEPTRRLFTLEQYERMVQTGILAPADRVELIGGEIVEMTPISPEHSTPVRRLARIFIERLGDRAVVLVQDAVRLPPDARPEPDVALARPPDDRYLHRHPGPDDLLLVVEVAVTTADYDRSTKIALYASRGIPEAWLADVTARRFEVYTDPGPDGYRTRRICGRGESASPQAFPELTVPVDEILP